MSELKRISWIDSAKGFGIILVLWLHIAIDDGFIHLWILSFVLPLFFFVNGYTFSGNYNVRLFLQKKIKAYVISYFLLIVPVILFKLLMAIYQHEYETGMAVDLLHKAFLQNRYLVLWFLPCLFWVNLLQFALIKITANSFSKMSIMVLLIAFCGLLYYRFGGGSLPWNIDAAATSLPFFYFGYLCRQKKAERLLTDNRVKRWSVFLLCVIMNGVFTFASFKLTEEALDINGCQYGFAIFTYIAAFCGTVAAVLFSMRLFPNFIRFIGRYSIYYFAWHDDIMKHIVNRVIKAIGIDYDNTWPFGIRIAFWGANVVLVIMGLTLCVMMIQWVKARVKKDISA